MRFANDWQPLEKSRGHSGKNSLGWMCSLILCEGFQKKIDAPIVNLAPFGALTCADQCTSELSPACNVGFISRLYASSACLGAELGRPTRSANYWCRSSGGAAPLFGFALSIIGSIGRRLLRPLGHMFPSQRRAEASVANVGQGGGIRFATALC